MSYTKKPSVVKIEPTVTHLQPDQFDNDEPIQSYPFGPSAMRVTTATGFPETSGDVITSRTTDDTGSQIFIGEKAYIRTFEGNVWSSWRELGESGGGGPVEWDDILNKPSQFPPSPHTHSIDDVEDLQTALDSKETPQGAQEKANQAETNAKNYTDQQIAAIPDPDWNDIQNKPSTFPPSTHTHAISDITNLQDELDSKETPTGAQEKVDAHANRTDNPHNVTKAQVGLSNVDNLSATAIRTDVGRSLRVEVVSSSGSETPEQGRIVFDMSQGKFFGGTGSEWL